MGAFETLEDLQKYSEELNLETLKKSSPKELYHVISHLRDTEAVLLRKSYHMEKRDSIFTWNKKAKNGTIARLVNLGLLKSEVKDKGKVYRLTRQGKRVGKLLMEDYFPYNTYPSEKRAITVGKIYRDFFLKVHYNRKVITSNSHPKEKYGGKDFTTQLIEFEDINPLGEEVGKIYRSEFKDNKTLSELKTRLKGNLKVFENSQYTRVLKPVLYNRRTDEIIFLISLEGQSVYLKSNNLNISYLRNRHGDDIKFLVNVNHVKKALFLEGQNMSFPVIVVDSKNKPLAIIGNDTHVIYKKSKIREILRAFKLTYDSEE